MGGRSLRRGVSVGTRPVREAAARTACAFGLAVSFGLVVFGTSGVAGATPTAVVIQSVLIEPTATHILGDVAADGTHVWVTNSPNTPGVDGSVTELNAADGSYANGTLANSSFATEVDPHGVASDGTHVWVTNQGSGTVTELNAADGSYANGTLANSSIPVGTNPIGISSDGSHVWVAVADDNAVVELDAATGAYANGTLAASSIAVPDPYEISSDGSDVWVTSNQDNAVVELDAATGTYADGTLASSTITVGDFPVGISADGTHVWVANSGEEGVTGSVTELDAGTGAYANGTLANSTVTVGEVPTTISSDGADVWVANSADSSVTELSAATGTYANTNLADSTVAVDYSPWGIASDGSHVWVTGYAGTPTLTSSVLEELAFKVPGSPTGISATAGDEQATISWTAPSDPGPDPITSYAVTATPTAGGSPTTYVQSGAALDVSGESIETTVTGLTNGTSYTFTVAATNDVGTGPASSASEVVTPSTVPDAPSAVETTAGDDAATISWTPGSDGGSSLTGSNVRYWLFEGCSVAEPYSQAVGDYPMELAGEVDGVSGESTTITGLTNGDCYTFSVASANADGVGAFTSDEEVTVPTSAPGSPTNVTAIPGNGQVTVSWMTPASTGGSPIVSYAVNGSCVGNGGPISAVWKASDMWSIGGVPVTGLTNGDACTFTVTATNADGTSAPSSPSTSVIPTASAPLITSSASIAALPGRPVRLPLAAATSSAPTRESPATFFLPGTGSWGPNATFSLSANTGTRADSGLITGTAPTTPGVYYFPVFASTAPGTETTQVVELDVVGFSQGSTSATFIAGSFNSATIVFVHSMGNMVLTGCSLPNITFTNNGDGTATFAGTPLVGAARPYPCRVTLSEGSVRATEIFELVVDQAPALSTASSTVTVRAGRAVSIPLTVTGFPAPVVALQSGAPTWLTATSRRIYGTTPSSGGSWTITVVASNGIGTPASQTITIDALA